MMQRFPFIKDSNSDHSKAIQRLKDEGSKHQRKNEPAFVNMIKL